MGMVLALGILSTSCVSKKKYLAAENRIGRMEKDSTDFEKKIKNLETDLETTRANHQLYKEEAVDRITALMSQLDEAGMALNEKDEALQERAMRLKTLEARLQRQQEIVNNLRMTVEKALVNLDSEDLSVEVKNGKVYISLSEKLLFPSASASLNKEGKDAIASLGKVLLENPQINIDVVGHTDSLPISTARYSDNWDLSVARATTITRLLTEVSGVPGNRLTASGMSDFSPVATNATKEGRAKNRRTEIILTPKLEELFKILEGTDSAEME